MKGRAVHLDHPQEVLDLLPDILAPDPQLLLVLQEHLHVRVPPGQAGQGVRGRLPGGQGVKSKMLNNGNSLG